MPPSQDQPNILRAPGDYEVTTEIHNDTYSAINSCKQNLSGRSVFITGGSRGLGRSMALSFAKAGASHIAVGARSDLGDLEHDIAEAALGANRTRAPVFLPIKLDVSDEASVSAAALEVEKAFGKLHVLINNAGILGKYGLIADSDPNAWWEVMNVNLRGPYLVTRAFLPLLLKVDGEKYIVNVCSGGALLTNPTLSAYQVSKSSLLKLTTLTNAEYSPQGLSAFAIHPGNVPTDIMGGPSAIPPHHKHVFVETPELSADSIVYLISEKRDWLGGRYVNCTWDLPELEAKANEIIRGDKLKLKFDYRIAENLG